MATSPTYVFSGLDPFIARAAAARGTDAVHMVKASGVWHVKQVQDALGQLPRLASHDQRLALMDHAEKIRDCVATILAGMDSAIAEVKDRTGLTPPADVKPIRLRDEPAPATTPATSPPTATEPRPARPTPGRGRPIDPAA